jgi:hypothetical protein
MGSGTGSDGDSSRRRAAPNSPDLAENGRPGSVSRQRYGERQLHGENAGAMGNASRGSGWRDGVGEGRTAVAPGRGASTRNRACRKAGRRGKRGQRCSLLQRGAPRALARQRKVAEQRHVGRPSCSGGGLVWLGFARRGWRLRVEGTEGAGWRLYRVAKGSRRAGLGCCTGLGSMPRPDSGSSPSLARGQGRTRRAGPAWR